MDNNTINTITTKYKVFDINNPNCIIINKPEEIIDLLNLTPIVDEDVMQDEMNMFIGCIVIDSIEYINGCFYANIEFIDKRYKNFSFHNYQVMGNVIDEKLNTFKISCISSISFRENCVKNSLDLI